ncbi:hypothetical protein, partial [Paenibacillus riograndensis]|uniref:hypothetical protein n=1 Tax=Paenibacillus riograndensis TaxID=483937 RepID=UPI001C0A6BC4
MGGGAGVEGRGGAWDVGQGVHEAGGGGEAGAGRRSRNGAQGVGRVGGLECRRGLFDEPYTDEQWGLTAVG